MKVLKSKTDFKTFDGEELALGDHVLIKLNLATGWAKLARVITLTKTQIVVEVVNVIPIEENSMSGVVNGFKDRFDGFFADWAWEKRIEIGRVSRFRKDSGVMVGHSDSIRLPHLCVLN